MDRRSCLRLLAAGSVSGLAGCSSVLGSVPSGDDGGRTFGTPVTYQGVRVTPWAYTTTNRIAYQLAGGGTSSSVPPVNSRFALLRIEVENAAESPRSYPSEAPLGPGTGSIEIRHADGVAADVGSMETNASVFEFEGATVTPYEHALDEAAASTGTLPAGTSTTGWAVETVPVDFVPAETTLEISWSGTPDGQIGDVETFDWRFEKNDYIAPGEI